MGDTVQSDLFGNVQTKLVNVSEYSGSENVVPIGRSTKYGNKFKMKEHGGEYTREGCVEAFEEWWYEDEQKALREDAKNELQGRTIGCYCIGEAKKYNSKEDPITEIKGEPSVCHGEVILQFLNNQR